VKVNGGTPGPVRLRGGRTYLYEPWTFEMLGFRAFALVVHVYLWSDYPADGAHLEVTWGLRGDADTVSHELPVNELRKAGASAHPFVC
jgi:hypothetical protein